MTKCNCWLHSNVWSIQRWHLNETPEFSHCKSFHCTTTTSNAQTTHGDLAQHNGHSKAFKCQKLVRVVNNFCSDYFHQEKDPACAQIEEQATKRATEAGTKIKVWQLLWLMVQKKSYHASVTWFRKEGYFKGCLSNHKPFKSTTHRRFYRTSKNFIW